MTNSTTSINIDLYIELINEIRKYTKNKIEDRSLKPFVPSTPNLKKIYEEVSYIDLNLYSNDPVIQELENYTQNNGFQFTIETQDSVTNSTNTLPSSPNSEDFDKYIASIENDRETTKKNSENRIDAIFDKIVATAYQHPDKAKVIADFSLLASTLWNALLDRFVDFCNYIIQNIINMFKQIWTFIKSTFENIVNTINSWFSFSTTMIDDKILLYPEHFKMNNSMAQNFFWFSKYYGLKP
ncbi:hypothetical protein [Candidatus Williamhamiltonella defendens]|uniref:hypothetical protein n=1 Tax=Candidatus Williamhamiltonella defendens TaxID=138072 RepID=UPI00158255C6|nr:hypothetical protein [Candidatus Hamiltonella defensa]